MTIFHIYLIEFAMTHTHTHTWSRIKSIHCPIFNYFSYLLYNHCLCTMQFSINLVAGLHKILQLRMETFCRSSHCKLITKSPFVRWFWHVCEITEIICAQNTENDDKLFDWKAANGKCWTSASSVLYLRISVNQLLYYVHNTNRGRKREEENEPDERFMWHVHDGIYSTSVPIINWWQWLMIFSLSFRARAPYLHNLCITIMPGLLRIAPLSRQRQKKKKHEEEEKRVGKILRACSSTAVIIILFIR